LFPETAVGEDNLNVESEKRTVRTINFQVAFAGANGAICETAFPI
jgi:hypothetical protein